MSGANTVSLEAPAKINLYLRVLGRREDGYHELDSLFLPLELADTVEVALSGRGQGIRCRCPGHPALDDRENLAWRAAAAFLAARGADAAVDITIHKRVWLAAGLGGGSSDAAAVLRGLARLLGPLPGDALQRVARELGADVPFFLDPRPSRATGIGDHLEPLTGLPALQLVLANPGRPLSTARVFGALGPPPSAGWRPPGRIHGANLLELVHNDLTPAARRLCPGLDRLEAAMRQHPGVEAVGLTGSGPTLFGVCDGPASAARLAEHLAETTGFSAQITRTVAA